MIKACLVVELEPGEKKVVPLFRRVTVGRAKGNDLCIQDDTVSKKHAVVGRVQGRAVIQDLGSRNGTYVNGRRVDKAPLANGDLIRVGRARLQFFQAEEGEKRDAAGVPTPGRKRLGEYLVEAKVVSEHLLAQALARQEKGGQRLGDTLVAMGVASDADIARALAKQLQLPLVHPTERQIPQEVLSLVPGEVALRNELIPVEVHGNSVLVAMANPLDSYALQLLRVLTGRPVRVAVAPRSAILEAIGRAYPDATLEREEDGDVVIDVESGN